LAILLAFLLYRIVRGRQESHKTYAELLEDYERWDRIVIEWRYPNGLPVPAHERGRCNRRYRESWRRVRNHPDHPKESETED
jgi:hypothetical protein